MFKRLFASLRTLRVRILAIVALCWLLPTLVLGVYMSSVFFDALREKTEQALIAGAAHAQELTQQELDRIIKKSRDVTYDEIISERAAAYLSGKIRFEDFFIACRNYWARMFQRERLMHFTACFLTSDPDGTLMHTADYATTLLSFRQNVLPEILRIGETLDTASHFAYMDGDLYHVRNLYNRRLNRFGMLALGLDTQRLFSALLDEHVLWQGDVDILLDDYVYAPNPDEPFSSETFRAGLYRENGNIYYAQQVPSSDYAMFYRIRLSEAVAYGQVSEYYQLIAILLLLLVPLEALIMMFVHRSLTKPLTRLAGATARLAGGELGVTVPAAGDDEIGRVGTAFNAMSLQMQRLIDKSYREELALRDARISALQSRINPHFLNNALELMNWQARLEGADTVSQMIEAMSTLINAAMDRVNQRTVPLAAEIQVADAYFFFIQQRFGDRISITKDLEAATTVVRVPRLIIQTLLENAVEHGIEPAGGGVIRLHVYVRDGTLIIDVANNGRPILPEAQEKIDALLSDQSREARSEHLGIRNVNLRLKLIYHDRAGLTVSSDAAGETLARITIPYKEAIHSPQEGDAAT